MAGNPSASLKLRRTSPTRLELVEGGGCLSLFGTPFLAAGVFMLLILAGVVPLQSSDGGAPGPWPSLLALMGIVFVAVGGWLVMGRSWAVVDGSRRTFQKSLGLLVPMRTRTHRLEEFTAVRVWLSCGDSESPDTYPVALVRGAGQVRVCTTTEYGRSRRAAAELAEVAALPLEDAVTAHATVLPPGALRQALADRPPTEADAEVARPRAMRSQVSPLGAGVRIRIPERGFRWFMLIPLAIVAGVLSCVVPPALEFLERTRTPVPVQWGFGGFALLLFAGIPALVTLSRIRRAYRGFTEVSADARGIELRQRGAWSSRVTRIAAADVFDVDYATGETMVASAAAQLPPGRRPPAGTPLPRWVQALGSKGVQVKHRGGITAFGAGLPGEEVRYLHLLVRRALRGGR